jgi:prepilin-type N-terminal cleavage/methylation domain-containing protein
MKLESKTNKSLGGGDLGVRANKSLLTLLKPHSNLPLLRGDEATNHHNIIPLTPFIKRENSSSLHLTKGEIKRGFAFTLVELIVVISILAIL